jgi:hypothetical protein
VTELCWQENYSLSEILLTFYGFTEQSPVCWRSKLRNIKAHRNNEFAWKYNNTSQIKTVAWTVARKASVTHNWQQQGKSFLSLVALASALTFYLAIDVTGTIIIIIIMITSSTKDQQSTFTRNRREFNLFNLMLAPKFATILLPLAHRRLMTSVDIINNWYIYFS